MPWYPAGASRQDRPGHRVQSRFVVLQAVAPVGPECPDGTALAQPVGVAGDVGAGARPGVVHGVSDHPGADGIARDVVDNRQPVAIPRWRGNE